MSSDLEDFSNITFGDDLDLKQSELQTVIHVRIRPRAGRKCDTFLEGLPTKYDLTKILKALRKKFHCNGAIVKREDLTEFIQLTGDQRKNIEKFLLENKFANPSDIKMHGF
ncbi:Protein translation factor SUI1 [Thelohanellus kitauei]|uniref:Protein translation factor SUI1 n=1 Tax=Thelohanellus kitauei TaxID=669202 RepID=A0A0C2MFQ9_THEKT|nr:Protein translation factor SUI1 [Thelohanellus kitauei]